MKGEGRILEKSKKNGQKSEKKQEKHNRGTRSPGCEVAQDTQRGEREPEDGEGGGLLMPGPALSCFLVMSLVPLSVSVGLSLSLSVQERNETKQGAGTKEGFRSGEFGCMFCVVSLCMYVLEPREKKILC